MFDFIFNLTKQQLLDFANIFYIQIAIAIVIIFFIFKSILAKFILKIIYIILKKNNKTTESPLFKSLKLFIFFLGIFLATSILPLNPKLELIKNEFFKIVIILFTTKVLTVLVNKDSIFFKKIFVNSKNESVNSFFCKIVRGILWILSFLIILKELDFDLTGLVAGLGVGSVIISLAAQDTVKSLLSGVTILTEKPFEIGDWIKVGNYQGKVLDITFKSTKIEANDNTIITIPNSTITEDCVINWNKLKSRRFDIVLNLHLDTTADEIKNIIDKIKLVLKNHPKVAEETVQVVFDSISAYSSDIRIFLYIKEADYIKYLSIKEELHFEILKIIDKENVILAYPTQTVYVENSDSENINKEKC